MGVHPLIILSIVSTWAPLAFMLGVVIFGYYGSYLTLFSKRKLGCLYAWYYPYSTCMRLLLCGVEACVLIK